MRAAYLGRTAQSWHDNAEVPVTLVLAGRVMVDRSYWTQDILIVTLFSLALFGFKLGERPLWSPDEGRYSEIPREMVASGDYLTPRLNGVKYFEKPPLFYWLQSLSIKIFGLNEWALRFWTAAFALLGCLAVYFAGRALYGRRTGLLAAVVLANSLLYYAMSRIITLDMAVSVLISCALLAFLLGAREPMGPRRRVAMWAFFLFAALATLTKGLIGIVIPALVIGIWIWLLGEWRVLKAMYLPSGIVLFLAVVLPWHVLIARVNPEFLNFYIVHEHFQRYLVRHHGSLHQVWIFVPVVLLGLFPWTAFLAQAIHHNLRLSWSERKQHQEALFLILWAGTVFTFFSFSSSKLIPYILPMFPPLSILLGRYFAEAWEVRDFFGIRLGYWILVIASLSLVAVGLISGEIYLVGHADAAEVRARIYLLAAVLVAGALATFLLGRRNGFGSAFSSLSAASVIMLLLVNSSLPLFNQWRSVKELAGALKLRLRQGDEVVSYQTYYQELPVYLERYITVVGWRGELEFGARVEDVSDRLIDEPTFWRRWNGAGTVYMLISRSRYSKLLIESRQKFHLVAQTDQDVLLSNKADPAGFSSRGVRQQPENHQTYGSRIERSPSKEEQS